ncbi:beta-ketoacyl synthase N-terminal-like domain-containing protein [Paenibacillus tyrfis]|uniref:beta-ketoacyl synthase N-terminal-like domain-containing protein n=1 Tax=Paenibacillus tyrfis TaxID=1501230 RepID=UPI00209E64BE|nr:beta-ketoacyl synthase N-terminal-like domain-containing protein [Paenibacillus tyrfis]MCP1311724.1 KR domain-containing protein [Paenibacillus tyrfis]
MGTSILRLDDLDFGELTEWRDSDDKVRGAEVSAASRAVAIIGMNGKIGAADDLEAFWELLVNGKEGLRSLPEQRRKDVDAYLAARGVKLPIAESRYVEETFLTDIAGFDPAFFGISQQEANFMDPNQRMFLETAWKALEDAGYGGEDVRGSDTGIFVGFSSDFGEGYRQMLSVLAPNAPEISVAGNIKSIIASRLAYHLNLRGPALLVDTACSSGLMAIYLACQSIRSGDCSMALAGAVKCDLLPLLADDSDNGVGIKDIQDTYAPDGHTRTFDDACSGTAGAEGCIAFVLKSLDAALRDGDDIRAVILGGAANQDGASNGITAPNSEAQEELIARALADAGISAESLSYIEAHGTATRLGDPIEISGLQRAFRHFTSKKQYCAVGSLKTNIGHLDNAAGLGGVAKVVLSMQRGMLPASLNFAVPNRNIPFVQSPLYVNDRTVPWTADADGKLRAGINSFGLSGTNCHLVLESAPKRPSRVRTEQEGPFLLPLSAQNVKTLQLLAEAYKDRLADPELDLADAVFTAAQGRMHHRVRLAVVFETREQLCSALERFAESGTGALPHPALYYGEHRVVAQESGIRKPTDITDSDRERMSAEAVALLSGRRERPSAEVLAQWAGLYVAGARLPWDSLTWRMDARRVPLPTYPFQHVRCWAEPTFPAGREAQARSHPLLDSSAVTTFGHTLFRSELHADGQWELADHKIQGVCVLPGTCFVEMMAVCVRDYFRHEGAASLKDIVFIHPFAMEEGASKELHLLAEDEENGTKRFRFASVSEDGEWVVHAEAYWQVADEGRQEAGERLDLQVLQKRLTRPIPMSLHDDLSRGLQLGDRWNGSFVGGRMDEALEEFLVELALPKPYRSEAHLYQLHPALMDTAVNAVNHLMGDGELYLPLSYGELTVYERMPEHIWVHLRKTDGAYGAPVHRFEIKVGDRDGNTVLNIRNYCIKSASHATGLSVGMEMYGYEQTFRSYPLPNPKELPVGAIVVAGKRSATLDRIVRHAQEQGRRVIEVFPEAGDWEQALAPAAALANGNEPIVLAMFEWSAAATLGENAAAWREEADDAVREGFAFLKAWTAARLKAQAGLAALTGSGWVVGADDRSIHPGQAALGGLWRVAALEFEAQNMRCLDRDDETPAQALLAELADPARPEFLAYRQGLAYEPAIQASPIPAMKEVAVDGDDGLVVISGGTGDLGLEVAGLLARRGFRRLALLGRRPVPAREEWERLIEQSEDEELRGRLARWLELESRLDAFKVVSLPLERYDAVASALAELRSACGRIRGVFHLAGRAGDGFMIHKTVETFRNVYGPKADGAWHLHLATLDDRPEFFIAFSSISSLLLNPGQSDYTAANLFLDALAEHRRRAGLPALSLQWPAWRETGIARRMGAVDEEEAFAPVNTAEALELLDRVLGSSDELPPVLMPGKKRRSGKPAFHQAKTKESSAAPGAGNQVKLLGIPAPDELDLAVSQIWARTLALAELEADEEFAGLGGNSLLTSQMHREFEKGFPGAMDIADLFTYTTIRKQAEYLRASTRKDRAPAKEPVKNGRIDEGNIDEILELLSRGEITVEESSSRLTLDKGSD